MKNPGDRTGVSFSGMECEEGIGDPAEALDMGPRENIAIVGGGGKTRLMFVLADALCSRGKRVITSTTTKVRRTETAGSPCLVLGPSRGAFLEEIRSALEARGQVFVGKGYIEPEKVEGIDAGLVDELFENLRADYMIVEADGSAGRPVKAHAEHEPVIASTTTAVVAVMGLEALGKRLGPDVVFREEIFAELTGLEPGDVLTAESLAKVFFRADGLFKGAPSFSRRIAFLNKMDRVAQEKPVCELAARLCDRGKASPDLVIAGSLLEGTYSRCRKSK